jgi:hypothetical protein
MLPLLAHLDEQAGKESQALNEKQEPEHHAFHVDAAVEHESSVISIKRQAASDGPRGCTASVRTAGKFFSANRNRRAQSPLGLRTGSRPSIPKAHRGISIRTPHAAFCKYTLYSGTSRGVAKARLDLA